MFKNKRFLILLLVIAASCHVCRAEYTNKQKALAALSLTIKQIGEMQKLLNQLTAIDTNTKKSKLDGLIDKIGEIKASDSTLTEEQFKTVKSLQFQVNKAILNVSTCMDAPSLNDITEKQVMEGLKLVEAAAPKK